MTTPDPTEPVDPVDPAAWAERLRALQPTRLDPARRAAILQAAGRAAHQRPRWRWRRPQLPLWPTLAAGFGLVALIEGVLLARRPLTVVVERVVVIRAPAPVAPGPIQPHRPPPFLPTTSPPLVARPEPMAREPGGRLGWADRLAERPPVAIAPRFPDLTGVELRRAMFRLSLQPPGGPS